MQAKIKYQFSAKLWQHQAPGGWVFVSLPEDMSKEIRDNLQFQEEGWGRMKATARIKDIEWDTAIWFDKKANTYLLPIKSDVRKKTNIALDDVIDVSVFI